MEAKRSCCSRDKCCCMPTEKFCWVFAVINAVIVGVSVIFCLLYAGYILRTVLDPGERRAQGSNSLFWFLAYFCIPVCLATVIAATFAILLCLGLSKKNPRHLMAYLVYGIFVDVLIIGGGAVIIVLLPGFPIYIYLIIVPIRVVHALMLILVYRTYLIFSAGPPPPSHRKLIST